MTCRQTSGLYLQVYMLIKAQTGMEAYRIPHDLVWAAEKQWTAAVADEVAMPPTDFDSDVVRILTHGLGVQDVKQKVRSLLRRAVCILVS